ncbi:MAG: hypothetical protein ACOCRK_06645 [bacterium]
MKKYKKYVIVLVIISVVLLGFGYYFYNKKIKLPEDGIYLYQTKGFLSFNKEERINIPLMMITVHDHGENPVLDYSNFKLITSENKEININISNDNIKRLYNEDSRYSLSLLNAKVNDNIKSFEQDITFKSFKYINDKDKEVVRDLGEITIEFLDLNNDPKVKFENSSVLVNSAQSNLIFDLEFFVTNKYNKDIKLLNTNIGIDGITPIIDTLTSSETTEGQIFSFEINEENKIDVNSCFAYIIKPKVEWEIDETKKISTVSNSSAYATSPSKKEIIDFLWECDK